MTDANKSYQLKTEGDRLIFTTSSFRAEKTSVLHSGVYTREFSSMLFASAVCIAAYMLIIYINVHLAILRYLILVLIFVITFLGSKKFIFKERHIEVTFDKPEKTAIINRTGIITKKTETIPFSNIESVELGSRKFVPENIDGIDFVQKISLQHGNAVPGLGDVEEFITLSLKLTDGSSIIIYAGKIDGGKIDGEPSIPLNEIRSFLNK
jgi:hypothetical protein